MKTESSTHSTVAQVLADVRERGDAAVREYSARFDRYSPESFRVNGEQLAAIMARIPQQVIDDIVFVQQQVRFMARKQLESITDFEVETMPGVLLGQKNVPIRAVGAYNPG